MGKTRDLFKSRDTKGIFHAKMGSIKDRNGMDLTEAEDIKKRWQAPWKFSSVYPQNQSLPTLLLCALTYTSDFMGGYPPPPSLSLKKS